MKAKKAATKSKKKGTTPSESAFLLDDAVQTPDPCLPPKRPHSTAYHRPQLLEDKKASSALLEWFDSISEKRQMPWRKAFIRPEDFANDPAGLQKVLARRAYEVWVSEIMLQQTRVSTVVSYFNNWISKWPTVEDLASATQDEVLAAWKGLGYYSRATRLHEAAQQIVKDLDGIIPDDVEGLLEIKGIGRYTAGAISSIVFGKAVPLLDGNVARVLCRQLGLYAKVKDKKIDDLLWSAADILVKGVAGEESDIPGRWNQAMMELGSTVCTPKQPKCEECPVRQTCRVYAEGHLILKREKELKKVVDDDVDIEDLCKLCEPLELEEVEDAVEEGMDDMRTEKEDNKPTRKRAATITALPSRPAKTAKGKKDATTKQRSLRDFAHFKPVPKNNETVENPPPEVTEITLPTSTKGAEMPNATDLAQIKAYCALFPKREPKKQIPEEECLVCVIRRTDSSKPSLQQYLIEQRPDTGLLASLWQFPTHTLPRKIESTAKLRKADAQQYVNELPFDIPLKYLGESGPVAHVFSHLKLKMYIHLFTISCEDEVADGAIKDDVPKRIWVDKVGVDEATLGTGMKNCWEMVKKDEP